MNLQDLILEFPEVVDDRGSLSIAEFDILPFVAKRVFWIYDIQSGKTRGGHAHRSCEEVVIALSGSFDIYVDDGQTNDVVRMSSCHRGIYIRRNVWCELRNFAPGTICLVFASEPYDSTGYINDYNLYIRQFN